MKIKIVFGFVALTIASITIMLTGCSFNTWVEVNGGDYIPIDVPGMVSEDPAVDIIRSMAIDRDSNTVKLILEDGSIINESFTARPRENWPSGCPANIGSTRMEVLDLEVAELSIGSIVITKPVLVRN